MKRLRLDQWASQLQPPRNPRLHLLHQRCPFSHHTRASPYNSPTREVQQRHYQGQCLWKGQRRHAASRRGAASAAAAQQVEVMDEMPPQSGFTPFMSDLETAEHKPRTSSKPKPLPSKTPGARKVRSAKLSALHARLNLPSKLPIPTLARCLIDPTADRRATHNNESLSILGQELLGYYTAEWLITKYPRLPMPVLFAAQYAYAGSQTLASMRAEWGVEVAAAPGPEVDPGVLQLKRQTPGNALNEEGTMRIKHMPQARKIGSGRRNEEWNYRRGMSSRIVYDDQFGDLHTNLPTASEDIPPFPSAPITRPDDSTPFILPEGSMDTGKPTAGWWYSQNPVDGAEDATTVEAASASFVRALTGALYLHAGSLATKNFHAQHLLSRHLPLHTLFNFAHPTRDLSRLCAREGFEPPVARLISETGRLSRTPVFVVGVFSGDDKLGEGAGASLNEGRVRAAAAALRAWYLYSPPAGEVMRPSEAAGAGKQWRPQMVDIGEIVT